MEKILISGPSNPLQKGACSGRDCIWANLLSKLTYSILTNTFYRATPSRKEARMTAKMSNGLH